MSRWRAASIHLAISAVVAAGALVLIMGVWYPPPYFGVSGAQTLILLLIGVDLALGPLLTLVVFDTRKKSLKFDLAVIALLQVAGLAYGVHVAFSSRPVFLVAERDQVTAIYANHVDMTGSANAPYQGLPLWGPKLVSLQLPDDPAAMNEAIGLMLSGGGGLRQKLAAYGPIELMQDQLLAHSRPAAELEGFGGKGGRPVEDLRYVPVWCRQGTVYMLLDAKTGEAQGAVANAPKYQSP